MTIRSDPAAPAGFPANSVERALYGAARDRTRVGELLDELRHGRLWLPLPQDRPVTDGDALKLPTVRYLDAEFIPAFTSAGQLNEVLGRRGPDMAGGGSRGPEPGTCGPGRTGAARGRGSRGACPVASRRTRHRPEPGRRCERPDLSRGRRLISASTRRRDRWLSDPRRPSARGTYAAAQRHRGRACAGCRPPSRPPGPG